MAPAAGVAARWRGLGARIGWRVARVSLAGDAHATGVRRAARATGVHRAGIQDASDAAAALPTRIGRPAHPAAVRRAGHPPAARCCFSTTGSTRGRIPTRYLGAFTAGRGCAARRRIRVARSVRVGTVAARGGPADVTEQRGRQVHVVAVVRVLERLHQQVGARQHVPVRHAAGARRNGRIEQQPAPRIGAAQRAGIMGEVHHHVAPAQRLVEPLGVVVGDGQHGDLHRFRLLLFDRRWRRAPAEGL